MIEARIYATVNGNKRTFVGYGKNSKEAARNARRRIHIYMDSKGDTASFEDNKVEILDTTYKEANGKPTTLAEDIFSSYVPLPA